MHVRRSVNTFGNLCTPLVFEKIVICKENMERLLILSPTCNAHGDIRDLITKLPRSLVDMVSSHPKINLISS